MISTETRHYIRYCIDHAEVLPRLAVYIIDRVTRKIKSRVYAVAGGDDCFYAYPADILEAARRATNQSFIHNTTVFDDLPSTGWRPGEEAGLSGYKAPLAAGAEEVANLDWYRSFDDPEDTFALHRFGWLLRWLSLRPDCKALSGVEPLLLDWIEKFGEPDNASAWETYSVSERVVNWLLFICATVRHSRLSSECSQRLWQSLTVHLAYISRNLEYHDSGYNNHILNNARALYIGGQLLTLSGFANLGRTILKKHVFEMIGENGELKEGSTHYQLLITRSFVEMVWVAGKTGDNLFLEEFEPVIRKMIGFCKYLHPKSRFLESETFPRIGDISPDFPVSWFFPGEQSGSAAESWWDLWDEQDIREIIEVTSLDSDETDINHSGFIKKIDVPGSQFSITTTAPPANCTYPMTHGHLDFGGFTLTDDLGAVLSDRGRFSYRDTELNRWAVSATAHNTSIVNGESLVPDCRGVYCAYGELLKDTKLVWHTDKEHAHITWSTDAVNRIARSTMWRRELTARFAEISLEEKIHNPRCQKIVFKTYQHFAPGWTLKKEKRIDVGSIKLIMESPGRDYSLEVTTIGTLQLRLVPGDSGIPGGWYFPDYGQRVSAVTLEFMVETDEQLLVTTKIKRI